MQQPKSKKLSPLHRSNKKKNGIGKKTSIMISKKASCLLLSIVLLPLAGYTQAGKISGISPEMLAKQDDAVLAPFSDQNSQYTTIKNVQMGSKQCLTLQSDNVNVRFEDCQDTVRQHWHISTIMTGYVRLTNQALADRAAESCLAVNAGHPGIPAMMPCTGSGFTSMRSWSIISSRDGSSSGLVYTFRNKYRNDLARREIMGINNGQVQMVSENETASTRWQLDINVPLITRPVVGELKALLIHVHYSDRAAGNLHEVQQAIFGSGSDTSSLAGAIRISSLGRLTLSGDTITDINLGPRPATCPAGAALISRVQEIARQRGVDLNQYNYTFLDMPSTPCNWAGLATMPGRWSIGNNSGNRHWMWQHEFGHNLGAPHATSLEGCSVNNRGVVQIDDRCRTTTASDPSDTMNGGGRRLYPAPYSLYAGWLTDSEFPQIAADGDYTLAPLFSHPDDHQIKAIRIHRTGNNYLTLEYRQPAEGFENWPANDPFVNGVIVRIATFNAGTVTNQLVDTTPGSTQGMRDAPLMPGKSIDDTLSGKRITLLRIDARGAHIRIQDINDAHEQQAPVAVVPANFSIVARHTGATIRLLDGRASTGSHFVWKSLAGNGAFGLQEVASGPIVQEVKESLARAAFPAGVTGTARYQLTAINPQGVADSKTVTVTVVPAKAEITGKNSVELGESVAFSGAANFDADSWRWSLKHGNTTVAHSSQATFNLDTRQLAAGHYQVELEASANNGQYLASASAPLAVVGKEETLVPQAVVPENFSLVARHTGAAIRLLDGRASTGHHFVWKSLAGNGAFGLQEVASGPVVQEVKESLARAAFPAGATGTAKYQLTATGSHGVTDSKIVTVTVVPAKAEITGKNSVEQGESVVFSGAANFDADSWRWSLKHGNTTVAQSSQANFNLATRQLAAGNYQLQLEASANNNQYLAAASAPLVIHTQQKPDTPTYPAYVEGTAYKAGDRVTAPGGVYSCKPAPYSGWCSGAAWAYAPGTGVHWNQAWDKVE